MNNHEHEQLTPHRFQKKLLFQPKKQLTILTKLFLLN